MIKFIEFIESILYYPIFGYIPFLVLWLAVAGLFFSIKLNFINLSLFKHGWQCMFGKYMKKDDPGKLLPRQSSLIALSATVGLGNIAGVAVAISLGGPGAVLWMVLMGFFGMSTIFAETLISQKYRKIEKDGTVSGGAFIYLKQGLADLKLKKLGILLSHSFAIFALIGFLTVAMFQSNQMSGIFASLNLMPDRNLHFSFFSETFNINIVVIVIAILLTLVCAIVLIGGVKRIAQIVDKIVPFMAIFYILCCVIILIFNCDKIIDTIYLIFREAFNPQAAGGGIIGGIIAGVKRATFSNEAGVGTTPIAHCAAKSAFPARQASVAMLSPFIDTVIVCTMTGLVIISTGSYIGKDLVGIEITADSFRSVSDWFVYFLTISVTLFSFSTIISYSYYSRMAWKFYFKKFDVRIFFVIYCFSVFIGCIISLDTVIRIGDSFFIAMSIPNLIGIYLMSNIVKRDSESYLTKLRSKRFNS